MFPGCRSKWHSVDGSRSGARRTIVTRLARGVVRPRMLGHELPDPPPIEPACPGAGFPATKLPGHRPPLLPRGRTGRGASEKRSLPGFLPATAPLGLPADARWQFREQSSSPSSRSWTSLTTAVEPSPLITTPDHRPAGLPTSSLVARTHRSCSSPRFVPAHRPRSGRNESRPSDDRGRCGHGAGRGSQPRPSHGLVAALVSDAPA